MKLSRAICATLILLSYGIECAVTPIPRVAGTSLAGEKVELPKDLSGPMSFLILGFSQKSSEQATEWGKAIAGLAPCQGRRLTWFQLPVIAGAPGLVRPLILRSMRSGLTRSLQQHFVPITDRENDWKLAVGYQDSDSQKDDAYVLAVDEKGQILAKWHGSVQSSEAVFRETFQRHCNIPTWPRHASRDRSGPLEFLALRWPHQPAARSRHTGDRAVSPDAVTNTVFI